ncbi:DNA mismatch repair endonuclease MutL [Algicola sagamiensis]|uniref:DNA mismatch repair endonuclease MutL n=1 Tax=Algicola sagamiensis TaxID=163869 RepID=UPI0003696C06|nr:DNA mismatch repair endonuclease MutL [Algicola sagamiensis]
MPIQVLPARLANQIAAGEVVERPASVVKELVENSLDAGATRIQIDIEKGGIKLIRVRDNGFGIAKNELTLALSRHATSKLSCLDDLEKILSLGFRGEALASISSVSRLALTSKTAEQSEAWQAYAEGRDMDVIVKPSAHPVGTTIEVSDLFFNTPARRKFLKSEKTEFQHIDELIKRIALARHDVSIVLTHNGKTIHQLRQGIDETQIQKRLSSICGSTFAQHAIRFSKEYHGIELSGWLLAPDYCGNTGDIQYAYVNGRMMRDKVIAHAIRQGFDGYLSAGIQPNFVLFVNLPPSDVDVNVHPAKHEVRFHEARLIHDLIVQTVQSVLEQMSGHLQFNQEAMVDETPGVTNIEQGFQPSVQLKAHSQPQTGFQSTSYQSGGGYSSGSGYQSKRDFQPEKYQQALEALNENVVTSAVVEQEYVQGLMLLKDRYLLCTFDGELWLVDGLRVLQQKFRQEATRDDKVVKSRPLLLPVKIAMTDIEIESLDTSQTLFRQLGIEIETGQSHILLKRVPACISGGDLSDFGAGLLAWAMQETDQTSLVDWIGFWMLKHRQLKKTQLEHWLQTLVPEDFKQAYQQCGRKVDMKTLIQSTFAEEVIA